MFILPIITSCNEYEEEPESAPKEPDSTPRKRYISVNKKLLTKRISNNLYLEEITKELNL